MSGPWRLRVRCQTCDRGVLVNSDGRPRRHDCSRRSPHRGRSSAGKRAVSIMLTDGEYADLVAMAEAECRSATAQIVWLVKKAIDAREYPQLAVVAPTMPNSTTGDPSS